MILGTGNNNGVFSDFSSCGYIKNRRTLGEINMINKSLNTSVQIFA